MLTFQEQGHIYSSEDNRIWTSVTSIISRYKEPFDREAKAAKCSIRKPGKYPNKWYGLSAEEILQAWDDENKRSTELGHWYHEKREQEYIGKPGVQMPVMQEGIKVAGNQKLSDGIYPEHLCYLESIGVCGQSDLVTVEGQYLDIDDWKSNKEIRTKGFPDWEKQSGGPQKMLKPIQHLHDCEMAHYALQLSLYCYIILRHNPRLQLRRIGIHHIIFERDGENEYGYPMYKRDNKGEYIVKDIVYYEIPYMLKEVNLIINDLKSKR